MGNRAAVIFYTMDQAGEPEIAPAVYIHWNGGPVSVYAFPDELTRRKVRPYDPSYAAARFCHVVCDYFDHDEAGGLSVGLLSPPESLDPAALETVSPGDNGVYLVTGNAKGWVVGRYVCGSLKPDSAVKRERRAARLHPYNQPSTAERAAPGRQSIAERFAVMRPKVSSIA